MTPLLWGLLLWAFYVAGQAIHVWTRASLAIASRSNTVGGYRDYIRIRGSMIVARVFLETCAFMVFEYGATAWFTLPSGGSPVIKVAMAGFFGFGGDALLDQAAAKMGLDKELPPRADGPPTG